MSNLFNLDNPVMRFLNRVADIMWINILTLICCIPVFTIGPALTAMHYVLLKLKREEEGYLTRMYFKSFRENFKQGTLIWLIILLILFIFGMDFYAIFFSGVSMPRVLTYAFLAAFVLCYAIFQWIFPLLSHFVTNIRTNFKNSLIMTFAGLPRTLGMMILGALPFAVAYFGGLQLLPILLLFGVAGPAYGSACLYDHFFEKFEPEDENEKDPDAMPEELMNYNPEEETEGTAEAPALPAENEEQASPVPETPENYE